MSSREIYLIYKGPTLIGDRVFFDARTAERYIGRTFSVGDANGMVVRKFREVEET